MTRESKSNGYSRVLSGVTVVFGEGATISNIRFPSDPIVSLPELPTYLFERLSLDPTKSCPGGTYGEELCPVCFTTPEDPYITGCGHTYCRSCLISQCESATSFPICCLGASNTCKRPLPLKELEAILSRHAYEALLQSAFGHHISNNPTTFGYCPTPDCNHIHRKTSPRVLHCDGCHEILCTACSYPGHPYKTCAEQKATHESTAAFAKWKDENDARDCPKCSTPILKADGCHHLLCSACNTHICWECMAIFPTSAQTYDHISVAHPISDLDAIYPNLANAQALGMRHIHVRTRLNALVAHRDHLDLVLRVLAIRRNMVQLGLAWGYTSPDPIFEIANIDLAINQAERELEWFNLEILESQRELEELGRAIILGDF